MTWLCPAAVSLAAPVNPPPTERLAVLHALILSGEGGAVSQTNTPFLRRLLVETGRFDVRVHETPADLTPASLAAFDVVVDDYTGARWGSAAERALDGFVASGKGVVFIHDAVRPTLGDGREKPWVSLSRLTKLSWPSGEGEPWAPFHVFELKNTQPEQPIIHGIKDRLRTGDRPLQGFKALPGAEVLATGDKNEPILISSHYGKGRVFCTLLGHDAGSRQEKAFITTFLRGAEWAATGDVSLPAEIGMPGPRPDAVRGLIIAGGHDHHASFYGLFEGYKDLGRFAVAESKMAFKDDIRSKYDVVVFYDFTRDLEERERKNLRDFVESGKGIVVLHHGILNFQKWPWWYEEVAGGRYRLDREGGIPNSTVKFGEEHLITPVPGHPITAGIGPFHVTDETYKGLFISPNIKPLLMTDNPTSDPVVGWVGPCTTSRVVFIQLGHDHTPCQHPSYRALVHNAVLWTAGKLN